MQPRASGTKVLLGTERRHHHDDAFSGHGHSKSSTSGRWRHQSSRRSALGATARASSDTRASADRLYRGARASAIRPAPISSVLSDVSVSATVAAVAAGLTPSEPTAALEAAATPAAVAVRASGQESPGAIMGSMHERWSSGGSCSSSSSVTHRGSVHERRSVGITHSRSVGAIERERLPPRPLRPSGKMSVAISPALVTKASLVSPDIVATNDGGSSGTSGRPRSPPARNRKQKQTRPANAQRTRSAPPGGRVSHDAHSAAFRQLASRDIHRPKSPVPALHLDLSFARSRTRSPNGTPHQTPRGTGFGQTPRRALSARELHTRARTEDPNLKTSISARLSTLPTSQMEEASSDALRPPQKASLDSRAGEVPAEGASARSIASLHSRDSWCPILTSVHQAASAPMPARPLQRSSSHGNNLSARSSQKLLQASIIPSNLSTSPEMSPRASAPIPPPPVSHQKEAGSTGVSGGPSASGEGESGPHSHGSLSARCPRTAAVIEHFRQRQRRPPEHCSASATAKEVPRIPDANTNYAAQSSPSATRFPVSLSEAKQEAVPPLAQVVTVMLQADDQQLHEVPLSARLVPASRHESTCRGPESFDLGDVGTGAVRDAPGGTGSHDAAVGLRQQLTHALGEVERLREEGRRRGAWGDAGPVPVGHEIPRTAQINRQGTLRWECPEAVEEEPYGSQVDYMSFSGRAPSIYARDGGSAQKISALASSYPLRFPPSCEPPCGQATIVCAMDQS